VFDSSLSVGALIGFQMLSGRVTQPLISIVGLVNEYQETALSVKMLGEVMNRAPEGRPAPTACVLSCKARSSSTTWCSAIRARRTWR
jgi:ABC-type bacteriocin/lantibiotic exporter with double-glycine peptidase domain